ncbi:glycosyltransferase [Modestobacter sp. I12A-02628]|uniref:Glycosyltransferase n=1 Tax=Goekera deserti TaxID=2497753 RepID=A0A7K3WH19_9ACTN|nr:glycosyltransferase [Goekera deserti]MPQ97955.1 glycosyltransferase [Goekera deserti]NDI48601.1 glycosyltransferase [Goekera deserti]NEL55020.1 glycosyltransferase [Goekera deserti]
MRSVVVAKFVPWPPNSGDKRRTLGIVRGLRAQGEVTLCAFAGEDEDAAPLEAEGIEVRSVPLRRRPDDLAAGLALGRSLTAARFYDRRLARLVAEAVTEDTDVLVVEHVQLLPYARGLHPRMRVVDMHNIESALARRMAGAASGIRRLAWTAETRALEVMERRVRDVDVVAVVSDVDRVSLTDVVEHPRVVVVPNAWDEPEPQPPATDPVVSFVALLSWGPNVDAATWFCSAVWPLVVAQLPEARLQLVGRNPAPEVQALAGDTVQVSGTVPDLAPWYARTRVAVAPLRVGGGSRLKILEALAAGRPVVATAVGAEGLEDLTGRGVLIADDPAGMAAEIVGLLADPARSEELGRAGVAAVAADHSWAAALRPLLAQLSAGPTTR